MIEVEKELEVQKKINQQQTLILLHLGKFKEKRNLLKSSKTLKNSKKQKKRQ